MYPKLFITISQLKKLKIKQKYIQGYKLQLWFLVMFTLITTARFPRLPIIAIHLCEQKWKSNGKAKKSQVLERKKLFSKAVNTKVIYF